MVVRVVCVDGPHRPVYSSAHTVHAWPYAELCIADPLQDHQLQPAARGLGCWVVADRAISACHLICCSADLRFAVLHTYHANKAGDAEPSALIRTAVS
jgi:hypothetical protein